jgi:hypothetical protein
VGGFSGGLGRERVSHQVKDDDGSESGKSFHQEWEKAISVGGFMI